MCACMHACVHVFCCPNNGLNELKLAADECHCSMANNKCPNYNVGLSHHYVNMSKTVQVAII